MEFRVHNPANVNLMLQSWLKPTHIDWDSQSMELESKSLPRWPVKSSSDVRLDALSWHMNDQDSIDAIALQWVGFGLTQSQSFAASDDSDEPYTYRNSNQIEYMGGSFFPYIDPLSRPNRIPALQPTSAPQSPQVDSVYISVANLER